MKKKNLNKIKKTLSSSLRSCVYLLGELPVIWEQVNHPQNHNHHSSAIIIINPIHPRNFYFYFFLLRPSCGSSVPRWDTALQFGHYCMFAVVTGGTGSSLDLIHFWFFSFFFFSLFEKCFSTCQGQFYTTDESIHPSIRPSIH